MAEIWYQGGLRFRCTRCGNCCTGAPGYVWVNEEEIRQIAQYRGEPVEQVSKLYVRRVPGGLSLREKATGECVMYDRKQGCTIYPTRPRQCRSWPFWESNVATAQDWQRTCDVCPGAGRGDLISSAEISKKLRMIKL
jgi:Fe-S-cluster containining protein